MMCSSGSCASFCDSDARVGNPKMSASNSPGCSGGYKPSPRMSPLFSRFGRCYNRTQLRQTRRAEFDLMPDEPANPRPEIQVDDDWKERVRAEAAALDAQTPATEM